MLLDEASRPAAAAAAAPSPAAAPKRERDEAHAKALSAREKELADKHAGALAEAHRARALFGGQRMKRREAQGLVELPGQFDECETV